MHINLLANTHRTDAVEAATGAAGWLRERGVGVGCDEESAARVGAPPVPDDEMACCDLVVCFGGDGTLIRAAHLCSVKGTPILGVYYGRFGFVTQCTQGELGACLSSFFDGRAEFEERMMLQADLLRGGKPVASVHALNEIVIQRATTVRMLTFEVTVDGHHLTTYPADGVIVATPTGSTAYNLSAGGPIMDPRMNALIVSAIAPHTLSARSLVLGPDSSVGVRVQIQGDSVLSADGQTRFHILSGDEVLVSRSPRVTKLMRVDKDDFLIKLGERLLWSQSLMPWEGS